MSTIVIDRIRDKNKKSKPLTFISPNRRKKIKNESEIFQRFVTELARCTFIEKSEQTFHFHLIYF